VSSAPSGEEVGKLALALARAAPDPRAASASELEPIVAEMVRRAQAAWPDFRVDLGAFFAHVAGHWPDEGRRTAAGLATLEVEDLYLAFACTQDGGRALRTFERELEGELRAAFEKLRIEPARRDDARQQLWEKLFVAAPRPRILDYSGRSRLKFWFRVTVLRALLDDMRSQKRSRERLDEDLLLGAASSDPNPEIEHLKRLYRKQFNAAFEEAVKSLRPEDRNVLRSSYAQKMTIDQIGAAFGIHRATAARRVNSARDNLLRETRRRLSEQLRLSSRELDSMFKLIESRLDISVGRLLATVALAAALVLGVAACQGPPVGPPLDPGVGQAGASGAAGRGGAGGGGAMAGAAGTIGTGGRGGGIAGASGIAGTGGTGGTTATAGTGGRGGSTAGGGIAGGAGRGGTGGTGGGCAAQMTPQMFYRGTYGPYVSESTSTRYYFAQQSTPRIAIQYSTGDLSLPVKHPFEFDPQGTSPWRVAAGEQLVAALWALDSKIAVWGPDGTSTQIGTTATLGTAYGLTVDGQTVFYSRNAMGGNPTPGIYQWSPQAGPPSTAATLFASYATLGGDWTIGHILRATPTKLLLSDTTDVRMVERAAPGQATLLFDNPGNRPLVDLRPARPRTTEGGVVVSLDDGTYFETGRDYYVHLSRAGAAPVDLVARVDTLAATSPCGTAARYRGAGVLYQQRYIYEGNGGVFAVDVDTSGSVSNLVRLTSTPLRFVEVTGDGQLFGSWPFNVSQWDYYRVGRL
jgi:RNA polymerase sigma-70 factor, ECF subfamily